MKPRKQAELISGLNFKEETFFTNAGFGTYLKAIVLFGYQGVQKDFASALGISSQNLSMLIHGKCAPSSRVLKRLNEMHPGTILEVGVRVRYCKSDTRKKRTKGEEV